MGHQMIMDCAYCFGKTITDRLPTGIINIEEFMETAPEQKGGGSDRDLLPAGLGDCVFAFCVCEIKCIHLVCLSIDYMIAQMYAKRKT
jgi:uncharacterized Fe-S radical SAM superfamily protein PflX